jgi:hypothetical protein
MTINNNNYLPGSIFPVGTTTVIWTATDASGNQSTCQFNVTVVDNQVPVINSCPANITHTADAGLCSYSVTPANPTATDNCGIDHYTGVRSDALALTAPYPVGTTTITWRAFDANGNQSAPCTQTITVTDDEDPKIPGMPANQTLSVPSNSCSALASWLIPTATDNCGIASLILTGDSYAGAFDLSGNHITQITGIGGHTFTYTATDVHGRTYSASFTITLVDNANPVFDVCPNNVTAQAQANCGAQVFYSLPQAHDGCGAANITINNPAYASGNVFPIGTTTVIYTATDGSNNSATCQFTITVQDNQAPEIHNQLLDITVNTDGRTTCDQVVNFTAPYATDACGPVTVDVKVNGSSVGSSITNTTFHVGTTPIVYTFTDSHGNSSSTSFNIIVVDNTAPQITTAAGSLDATVQCGDAAALATALGKAPIATDNCGIATIHLVSDVPTTPSVCGAYDEVRTWNFTDGNGNTSASFVQTIHVVASAPQITACPADQTFCQVAGDSYTIPALQASAACGSFTVSFIINHSSSTVRSGTGNDASGSFPAGTSTISWTVSDGCGHSSVCTTSVVVNAPLITASAGPGGQISDAGSTTLTCGGDKTYTITADPCYHIGDVLVDGVSQGAIPSYTFNGVTSGHTISATFVNNGSNTITASAGTGGSISPNGGTSVPCGGSQSYTITPDACHDITDVLVDGVSLGAVSTYNFTNVVGARSIVASFTLKSFTITVTQGANGNIAPGTTSLNCGSNQLFSIAPNAGYHIVDVVVDGSSVGAVSSYPFNNVTANHSITASFASDSYTITATSTGNGSINPGGTSTVSSHGSKSYTITADPCNHIVDVIVDNVSQGAISSYTFNDVTANHTISASFAPSGPYTINATAGTGGTITPSGSMNVGCGGSQTYNITPGVCSHIVDVTVDGTSVGAVTSYTFSDVHSNHTINATFAPDGPFTINASAGAGGTISPAGFMSVACGGSQTYTISATACNHILDVLVDGLSVGAVSSYTFSDVHINHTISVTFVGNSNSIVAASAGSGGTISPSGNISVGCGGDQTFSISANACNHIQDVTVDGVSVGAVSSYTITNVTTPHTIIASFAPNGPYTINASAGAGGSISPSGFMTVGCNGSQTFTITPDACSHIADVLVDNISVGAVGSYTFSNVTANHTISATFTAGANTISVTQPANGAISPGTVDVACGGSQTFNISSSGVNGTCYHVVNVTVDGVSQGAMTSYTFNNVTAPHSITATLAPDVYTITVTQTAHGTISGSSQANCGGNATFTITPDPCYQIATLTVDGAAVIPVVSTYTFNSISNDHTITATYSSTAPNAPTGSASQSFCSGATVANLVASGTGIKWYDAPTNGNLLSGGTLLVNNQHYYATQTVGGCESITRLDVTATLGGSITPTVSIAASPSGAICAGTSVTFTATAGNLGGGTVTYNFKVNGSSVQNNSSNTYTSSSLGNGNTVTCTITITGGTCLLTNTANSNTITMSVNSSVTPAVSISASPSGSICAGTSVTFTANASNLGGGTANYNFKVNGISVQNTSSNTYTSSSLANGNTVTCTITITGGGCRTTNTANSNTITMSVNASVTPAVSISASPSGSICAGTPVTFTANASNLGGGTASYNFKVNGSSVQNTSSNTYTSSSLGNGNTVTCTITITGGGCRTTNTANSNTITMSVNSSVTPAVSISASPSGSICVGTSVTFTANASNLGGGTASYNFKVNGASVQNGSSNTYTSSSLANGNTVTCTITITGGGCRTSNTANSNTITMTVNSSVTPTVSIAASPSGGICAGTPVTFTATAGNLGGGTVTYNFKVGNTSVQNTSSNTYTSSSLANGNTVTCTITITGGGCRTSNTANSNSISMVVTTAPTVFTLTGSNVCSGTTQGTVKLSNSQSNVSYQLWLGNSTVQGSKFGADGSSITWNNLAAATGYYVVASRGTCTSTTNTVNIGTTSISYPGGPFCKNGVQTFASVNQTGTTGGTYSASPAGLVINNTTGEINLQTSQAKTYTVSYLVNGCTATTTVKINTCNGNNTTTNTKLTIQQSASLTINVWPIPTQTYFSLQVQSAPTTDDITINVYDVNGKKLQQLKGSVYDTYQFGSTYVAGTYMVEVIQGTSRVTQIILKQ